MVGHGLLLAEPVDPALTFGNGCIGFTVPEAWNILGQRLGTSFDPVESWV
jgi:hypothetical protein